MWYVYILKSKFEKWCYVGSTNDIIRRTSEHKNGKVKSTRPHRPLGLIFTREFSTEHEAREYEQKLKKCRKEKENIIKSLDF